MSVQTTGRDKHPAKSTTVYLMELRRRTAEANRKRQRLEVASWSRPEVNVIPIRRRQPRTTPPELAEKVTGTGSGD
jgi:hypothetical protein